MIRVEAYLLLDKDLPKHRVPFQRMFTVIALLMVVQSDIYIR